MLVVALRDDMEKVAVVQKNVMMVHVLNIGLIFLQSDGYLN